jgi:CBS-domain-containing membrane protein
MPDPTEPGKNRLSNPVVKPHRTRIQAVRHRKAFRWIDPKFTHSWRAYVGQSAIAAGLLWIVLLTEDIIANGVVIAAIASSVAIVFLVPHSVASAPSRILGGHLAAVVAAYVVVSIGLGVPGSVAGAAWFVDLSGALSLGLVVLLMAVTNTEHPPAAGSALGLAVRHTPLEAVLFIITAAVIVAAARVVLAPRLRNLL